MTDNGVNSDTCLKVVYLSAGVMNADNVSKTVTGLTDVGCRIELTSVNSEAIDHDKGIMAQYLEKVEESDFFFMRGQHGTYYVQSFPKIEEILRKKGIPGFVSCALKEETEAAHNLFIGSDEDYSLLYKYLVVGGEVNNANVLRWAAIRIKGMKGEPPVPDVPRSQGLYHPGHPDMDEEKYLSNLDPEKPTVGVIFRQYYWIEHNLAHIDAIINTLEMKGVNVIPMFCLAVEDEKIKALGTAKSIEKYMMRDGKPIVDSVIISYRFSLLTQSMGGRSSGETDGIYNFFEKLNVVAIQAPMVFRDYDSWMDDDIGLTSNELMTCAIWPEFDGQIISVPLSFMKNDGYGFAKVSVAQDRVDRLADTAIGWARLHRKTPKNVKTAIMLNMYPPSEGMIGGATGLDTMESLVALLRAMRECGYDIPDIPKTGEELLSEISSGITNCLDNVNDTEIPIRAADMLNPDRYKEWFLKIPEENQKAIIAKWGDVPGSEMVLGNRLIIPGIVKGNVFIGMQPARGSSDDSSDALYHSADAVITHNYLAYYRWIKEEFKADVLIHFGTHGSLEWLPGKNAALSKKCYADFVLDSLPNLYSYIIDDPGEGVGAKRRTSSVIVDYMMPTMVRADSYDRISDLDHAVQEYMRSTSVSQTDKSDMAAKKICSIVRELSLYEDLKLSPGCSDEDIISSIELLYDYICELKDASIKDGLHVLGHVPEGKDLVDMVYGLTRVRNGKVPSVREAVASSHGLDYQELLDNPSKILENGKLAGTEIDELDGEAYSLLTSMESAGFDEECCLIGIPDDAEHEGLVRVIRYICTTLVPAISKLSDEIDNLVRGLHGEYIDRGPSGSPTRGNADMLPTGKNFYSLSPDTIPSDACWQIGVKMANTMLEKTVEELGRYPENLGITIWAIDTIKTGGDDIAYILYLMGVRPTWSKSGSKVTGLEVIPLEELGRPRIDVTVRISGMFRDAFPNLIELLDQAVELVANLDEEEETNYLKKHLIEDISRQLSDGIPEDEARSIAMVRVFGDPPGNYGVGIEDAIASSKWKDVNDLGEVYASWGGYAYTRKYKGKTLTNQFKNRMSSLDVTIKNVPDREFDVLDVDDFYQVIGGMNAAAQAFGGRKPISFMGDSSDRDRLRTRTLSEETSYVMRSRVLNPKWFNGLKKHGYRGAQELAKTTEHMLGWSATTQSIEPWMYKSFVNEYLLNKDVKDWLMDVNPHSLESMLQDIFEVIERGLWEPDQETVDKLKSLFLELDERLEDRQDRSHGSEQR